MVTLQWHSWKLRDILMDNTVRYRLWMLIRNYTASLYFDKNQVHKWTVRGDFHCADKWKRIRVNHSISRSRTEG